MSIAILNRVWWKSIGDHVRAAKQWPLVQWFIHWPNLYEYWNNDDDPPNAKKK